MSAPVLARPRAARASGPQCGSFVGTAGIRVTRLDGCGRPAFGENKEAVAVSAGIVSVEYEPEVEEGEDRSQVNAAGVMCVSDKAPDALKWFNVTIEFCNVDPSLFQICNPNWAIVRDAFGNATGFEIGEKFSDTKGFSLETWPRYVAKTGGLCGDDEDEDDPLDPLQPTGYFLLPWVLGVAPDSWTLENGVATFSLKGRTKAPSPWKKGPYLVKRDANGHPSPLINPIEDGTGNSGLVDPVTGEINKDPRHYHADITTVGPPTDWCGARDLIRPTCAAPLVGREVTLTVANADDLVKKDDDGKVLAGERLLVSWGDGTNRENLINADGTIKPNLTHTYADTVTFPVHVRVQAPSGAFCDVEVNTPPPTEAQPETESAEPAIETAREASAEVTQQPHRTRRGISLNLSDVPDGELAVDWGDGQTGAVTGPGPHRHLYRQDGTFQIRVTDPSGVVVTEQEVTVPFTTDDPHDGK